jgi:hypothetical protein
VARKNYDCWLPWGFAWINYYIFRKSLIYNGFGWWWVDLKISVISSYYLAKSNRFSETVVDEKASTNYFSIPYNV